MRPTVPTLLIAALAAAGIPFPASPVAPSGPNLPIASWQAPASWTPDISGPSASSRAGVSDAPLSDISAPLPFVAVSPCRLADTRSASGFPSGYGPPSIASGAQRTFVIAGTCGIPAHAQAVSFNFTVWAPVTRGDIRVFPAGGSTPLVSSLNWEANILALANAAVVALGTGGAITVQVDGPGAIDLIVDVNGYYAPLAGAQAVAANPLQLAILRWHPASLASNAFPVGTIATGIAFDGGHIWVADETGNTVTKLRATDGANLGTFPAGTSPEGMAFDGTSLWIANFTTNAVTRLRTSDGANLGTFSVPKWPVGVAFDGSSVWVVCVGANSVTKLRASDGANLGTFAVGLKPRGVAFDGSSVWVVNYDGNNVTKLRVTDGTNLGTFSAGTNPYAVAFDGSSVWVANYTSNDVTRLRASDGASLGTFAAGTGPSAVAFDGAHIWIASLGSGTVTKLRASDGANLGTFPTFTAGTNIAFDGANIWVTSGSSAVKL